MWLKLPSSVAERTSLIIGCVLAALGLVMMIAWQFEAAAVLKLGGAWPMIRFNTAATFFISGLAMVASAQQRRRWAVGLATLVILTALLHALEWCCNLGVGLEYLLHQPRDEFIKAHGRGRFGIGAAICFALFGVATIDRQSARPHPEIASLLGYFVILLALVALYRYGMGIERSIGWRLTAGMALATALGIFLLGISTVAMAIASSTGVGPSPWLAAYPAAFTLAAASFIIWIELKQVQAFDLRRDTAAAAANLRLHLVERMMTRIYPIEELSRNWERLRPAQRRTKVETLLQTIGSLQAVDWIDNDFRTAWHGSIDGFDATVGDVLPPSRRRDLIVQSEASRWFRFIPEANLTHGDVRIVGYAPTFDGAHLRTGFNAGVFRVRTVFDQLARNKWVSRFAFAVNEGERQLYCSSPAGIPRPAIVQGINFKFRGLQWKIDVWPTPATAAQGARIPDLALAKGLLSAALLGAAIHLGQRAALRTAEAEQIASAWRESEQRFELAVGATNDGIWEWHAGQTTFHASRRYRELFGYPLTSDNLDIDGWFRQLHPEDRPQVDLAVQAHLRDRTPYEVTARYFKLSGEMIWVRVRGRSIWDSEGNQLRMAGSAEDVTKEIEGERQLLSQVATIAATNRALTEMASAARAAAQAKAAFLRNMSHELRTPLNSIIGFSHCMLRRAETEPLDEHQRDRLQRIVASGKHLLQLVDNVLDISKAEAGQSKLQVDEFSLADLFDEVTAMTETLLQKKSQVRLQASIDADVPTPVLDQTKLKQILLNLLGNAAKFTDQGSITLAASFGELHWRFAVSDTGIGIPVEDQQRIFDNFEQVKACDRSTEGTGLGLPISVLLAHAMGGAISLESRVGVGSTFTLVIPQAVSDGQPGSAKLARRLDAHEPTPIHPPTWLESAPASYATTRAAKPLAESSPL